MFGTADERRHSSYLKRGNSSNLVKKGSNLSRESVEKWEKGRASEKPLN